MKISLRFFLPRDAKGESYRAGDSGGFRGPGALYTGYKVLCRITQISKLKLKKEKKSICSKTNNKRWKDRQDRKDFIHSHLPLGFKLPGSRRHPTPACTSAVSPQRQTYSASTEPFSLKYLYSLSVGNVGFSRLEEISWGWEQRVTDAWQVLKV